MSQATPDIIDTLAGIEAGSRLDLVRSNRPAARENAQKSYLALFAPETAGTVTIEERFAIALFVAALHRDEAVSAHYRDQLAEHARTGLVEALDDEIRRGATNGPYGRYPAGPLTTEDAPGITHRVVDSNRKVLGNRLAAGVEHTHLLVFRPRDASSAALQALLDAGWSTSDIVTLSQLVAFLSFQIRVVTGFRALAASQLADAPYAAPSISPAAVA